MAEDWTPKDNWSPNNHNHDSKYSKLSHLHDDRYSQTSHNHDDVYSKLGHVHDYAASNHNHDTVYSKLGHTHDYAASNHNHDSVYSKLGHVHDYAASNHNHDNVYSKLNHTHSQYVVPGDYVVERGTVTTVSGDNNQISCEVQYELWKSGWLVQSGLVKSTSNAQSRVLYFAKEYRDTEYSIVATKIKPNQAHNTWHPADGIGVMAYATNSCSIGSTDDGGTEVMIGWVARGYAAV